MNDDYYSKTLFRSKQNNHLIIKKGFLTGTAVFSLLLMFAPCGGEIIDGAALTKEVCDCTTKVNALPASDENRRAEQDKCMELQKTNWEKVKGGAEQEKGV